MCDTNGHVAPEVVVVRIVLDLAKMPPGVIVGAAVDVIGGIDVATLSGDAVHALLTTPVGDLLTEAGSSHVDVHALLRQVLHHRHLALLRRDE